MSAATAAAFWSSTVSAGTTPSPLRFAFANTSAVFVVSLVVMTLPDADAARLDEEGARLTALLETARAESRTSGVAVWWVPRSAGDSLVGAQGQDQHFQFLGLPKALALPGRWLDARVAAQVVGARAVVLGPEAILPAQRIVLSLGERRLELASDGLGPFSVAEPLPAERRP